MLFLKRQGCTVQYTELFNYKNVQFPYESKIQRINNLTTDRLKSELVFAIELLHKNNEFLPRLRYL